MKEKVLKLLEGKTVHSIGRTGSMLWIGFGQQIWVKDHEENLIEKPQIELNLQCPWRIRKNNNILLASNDIFEPNTKIKKGEVFNWEEKGTSCFDTKIEELDLNRSNMKVTQVKISKTEEIKIYLSEGNLLETFIDTSTGIECWRIIDWGISGKSIISPGLREE
jgi:hypothetical protein